VGQSLELHDREAAALNRLTPFLYEQLRRLALTVANLTSEQPGEEVLAIDEALGRGQGG
jgi:hypothetical protein